VDQKYALKKIIIQGDEELETVRNEIEIWKSLGDHKHICKYIDSSLVKDATTGR